MANWADSPATSSAHVRTVHINELRRTVLRDRYKAGLGGTTWTDGPWVTSRTHFRAIHFNELHDAMTPYLGTLTWSVGSAPSSSRPVSARDINDLRTWCDRFSGDLGLPTGPDPAEMGINSFSFDPTQVNPMAQIDADWVADIAQLTPTTTPLWVRTEILADASDNLVNYYLPYQTAFRFYQNANMPVFALLDYKTATAYPNNRNDNMSDSFFSNPFIDYFAARAADFANNMAAYNVRSHIIWNEPNAGNAQTNPNYLDARVFASLLYHCYTQINALGLGVGVIMGGLLRQDTINHDSATAEVVDYLTRSYTWLQDNGLGIPWDAVNVHPHNCGDPSGFPAGFSQDDMTKLRSGIDGIFALSDRRPVFAGEWGPDHSGAQNSTCMSDAYVYLRNTFDAMFYFQHPTLTSGCCGPTGCPKDYGATAWEYVQGTSYKTFRVTTRCTEWQQLQALLETRNS